MCLKQNGIILSKVKPLFESLEKSSWVRNHLQKSSHKKELHLREEYQDIVPYGRRNDDRICYSVDR